MRRWVMGKPLFFLGQDIQLHVDVSILGHGAYLSQRVLRVYAPAVESVRAIVIAWYHDQAMNRFQNRVAALAPLMDVSPSRVIISDVKHQWGSCNSKGHVRLNWRLMQASPAVIDYVVIHELAHL